jgi:hypothetical protein
VADWIWSGAWLVVIFLLWYVLFHPEKAERIASWIYKLFTSVSLHAERGYVASDIQATVNTVAANLRSEARGVLPQKLKVRWVRDETREVLLRDGEMIVCLRHHSDQARNLVIATMTYLSKALLPIARPYLGQEASRSIDFTVARRVFLAKHPQGALAFFHAEVFEPEVKLIPALREICQGLERLDDAGFFTRIVLNEYATLGARLHPRLPEPAAARESRELLEFLLVIVNKERGEDVPLTFLRRFFKVAVVLVARATAIGELDTKPYLEAIRLGFRQGAETVYVCGRGFNVDFVKRVCKRMVATKEGVRDEHEYRSQADGSKVPAICVVLRRAPRQR